MIDQPDRSPSTPATLLMTQNHPLSSDHTRSARRAPLGSLLLTLACSSLACLSLACSKSETPAPQAEAPESPGEAPAEEKKDGQVEVVLCDGETKTVVPEGTSGTTIAGALMAEWIRKNPDQNWEAEERERHTLVPSADNSGLVGNINGHTYGKITEADVALWKTETERVALAGSEVFHSADQLGSTVGVSCDMCHPHAANTHPETYPKYQTQLGRVVLMRDMINWCIEHPVRGKPLPSDDPRMRALESYILAQRSGKVLSYGKH